MKVYKILLFFLFSPGLLLSMEDEEKNQANESFLPEVVKWERKPVKKYWQVLEKKLERDGVLNEPWAQSSIEKLKNIKRDPNNKKIRKIIENCFSDDESYKQENYEKFLNKWLKFTKNISSFNEEYKKIETEIFYNEQDNIIYSIFLNRYLNTKFIEKNSEDPSIYCADEFELELKFSTNNYGTEFVKNFYKLFEYLLTKIFKTEDILESSGAYSDLGDKCNFKIVVKNDKTFN